MRVGFYLRLAAVFLAALAPSYLVERVTEYYFLNGSPLYGTWSPDRMELFTASIFVAAVASGLLVGKLIPAAVAYLLGIFVLVSLLFVFCDPRVCYSSGLDGLEPLRMAFFFSCIGIAGVSIGSYARMRRPPGRLAGATVDFAVFGAISFLPVIYTIAGVRIVPVVSPWAVVLLVGCLSFVVAVRSSSTRGLKAGLAVPVSAGLVVLGLSLGIARQYLGSVAPETAFLLSALIVGAAVGVLVARGRVTIVTRATGSGAILLALAVIVLLMLTAVPLDAVAGVTPQQPSLGSTTSFLHGTPVYAGGYMATGLTRPEGVSTTVNFSGTNASTIQPNNFLSAGIGIHAAGCCVDGIDYGYRFDVYLFHDGSESLVASAWQICDTVSACGGHSWTNLMLLHAEPLNSSSPSSDIHLVIQWKETTVYWSYAIGTGPAQNFTSLPATSQENAEFDAGTSLGAYFFQFGIMSAYPIGHPGWTANFECPADEVDGAWQCVPHASSLQGAQSYWKALWRWGETYNDVAATPSSEDRSVSFSFATSTMTSFQPFW